VEDALGQLAFELRSSALRLLAIFLVEQAASEEVAAMLPEDFSADTALKITAAALKTTSVAERPVRFKVAFAKAAAAATTRERLHASVSHSPSLRNPQRATAPPPPPPTSTTQPPPAAGTTTTTEAVIRDSVARALADYKAQRRATKKMCKTCLAPLSACTCLPDPMRGISPPSSDSKTASSNEDMAEDFRNPGRDDGNAGQQTARQLDKERAMFELPWSHAGLLLNPRAWVIRLAARPAERWEFEAALREHCFLAGQTRPNTVRQLAFDNLRSWSRLLPQDPNEEVINWALRNLDEIEVSRAISAGASTEQVEEFRRHLSSVDRPKRYKTAWAKLKVEPEKPARNRDNNKDKKRRDRERQEQKDKDGEKNPKDGTK